MRRRGWKVQRFDDAEEAAIVRLYQSGLGSHLVAERFGTNRGRICAILKKRGVPIRGTITLGFRGTAGVRIEARRTEIPTPTRWRCDCGKTHQVDDRPRCPAPWEMIDAAMARECRALGSLGKIGAKR